MMGLYTCIGFTAFVVSLIIYRIWYGEHDYRVRNFEVIFPSIMIGIFWPVMIPIIASIYVVYLIYSGIDKFFGWLRTQDINDYIGIIMGKKKENK